MSFPVAALGLPERVRVRLRWVGECLEWQGYINENGYGRLRQRGANIYVHRLVAEVMIGRPLEPGEIVRHMCDNRRCCNPDHLVLGSLSENVRDMDERGRRNPARKRNRVTPTQVRIARMRFSLGQSVRRVASDLNLPEQTVRDIRDGKTHNDIPEAAPALWPLDIYTDGAEAIL